jgi:hypothetical protein
MTMEQTGPYQTPAHTEALFDRFAAAFATFDAANVVALFAIPSVALRADGSIVAFSNREDALRYYQAALDGYHGDGCRTCRWLGLEVIPIGSRAMLATVTWELLRGDESIATRWRQSYCLSNGECGAKIFAAATHSD